MNTFTDKYLFNKCALRRYSDVSDQLHNDEVSPCQELLSASSYTPMTYKNAKFMRKVVDADS